MKRACVSHLSDCNLESLHHHTSYETGVQINLFYPSIHPSPYRASAEKVKNSVPTYYNKTTTNVQSTYDLELEQIFYHGCLSLSFARR